MRVILVDDVLNLGKRGDVVKVADGYGRNYLLPKRLAIPATPGNIRMVEQQRLALAKKEAKYKEEAQLLAQELNQLHVVISRKAGETGVLFGSVTSKDLADILSGQGINLDRRRILLDQPIKRIGNYRVELRPHSEVEAELLVSVLPEGDEAVQKVKRRDEESDRIISDLEAKVKEIEQLAGLAAQTQAAESAAPGGGSLGTEGAAEDKKARKKARSRKSEGGETAEEE